MRSFRHIALAFGVVLALGSAKSARADTQAGFLVQHFDAAPAGAGWMMLDNLALDGGLGGAVSLTGSYAGNLLTFTSLCGQPPNFCSIPVVSDLAHANLGVAVTWNRVRFSADLGSPLYVRGQTTTVNGTQWIAPRVDIASHPDSFLDTRLGVDARLAGSANGAARFGMGLHVYLPTGDQAAYLSDGQVRADLHVAGAGDLGPFSWAARLGARYQALAPVSPEASQIHDQHERGVSVGIGASWRVGLGKPGWTLVLGPEVSGVIPLTTSAGDLTPLLASRVEVKTDAGQTLRFKLAGGKNPLEYDSTWRVVVGIELVGLAGSVTDTAR